MSTRFLFALLNCYALLSCLSLQAQDLSIVVDTSRMTQTHKVLYFAIENKGTDTAYVYNADIRRAFLHLFCPYRRDYPDYTDNTSAFYESDCGVLLKKGKSVCVCIPPHQTSGFFPLDLDTKGYTLVDVFDVPFEVGKSYKCYIELRCYSPFKNCIKIYQGVLLSPVFSFTLLEK